MGKLVATERLIPGNQMVASELTHGLQHDVFTKNSNGTLGGGDLYSGCMADIKRS
jgi:hypothetical protein